MENRKKLHDYGLVLVVLGILNLFMFISDIVVGLVDGTIAEAFATVDADIAVAVKVTTWVIIAIMALIVFADVLIGIKALKVSKNPNTDKGYITAAKVFFVMSIIAAISNAIALIDGSAPVSDTILNLANSTLGAAVYVIFIDAAQAVRRDVLNKAE